MTYQDQWINGRVKSSGIRECSSRYDIVRDICNTLPHGFTVCDIGANMCYFGIRITEDFKDSVVMSFEYNNFNIREAHVKKANADRLILFKRKLSLADMDALIKTSHFDLVLALSVIHHLPGSVSKWIESMRRLGDNVIIEYAKDDSKRVAKCIDYFIPEDRTELGTCKSHIDNSVERPIILLRGIK